MAEIALRAAVADDAEIIFRLVHELAAYQQALHHVQITVHDLRHELAASHPAFACLIADLDGLPAGIALYFQTFSTWEGRRGIYLEDLYVRESARGQGVGRRLMAELARLALERGCARLDLRVLDWLPARRFYEGLGFSSVSGGLSYRVRGEALVRLAVGG